MRPEIPNISKYLTLNIHMHIETNVYSQIYIKQNVCYLLYWVVFYLFFNIIKITPVKKYLFNQKRLKENFVCFWRCQHCLLHMDACRKSDICNCNRRL